MVVARRFAGRVVKLGHLANGGRPAFPHAIALPQILRRGEFVQSEVFLEHAIGQCGVAEHKAVAVAGKAKGHAKQIRIVDCLGHARAHGLVVVFGLDHRNRDVGFEKQSVVGPQHGALVAVGFVPAHTDVPCPQEKLTVNLVEPVPPGLLHGRTDELVADVAFGELFLVQAGALG